MKTAEIVYTDGTKTEITIDGIEKISIITKDSDMMTDAPIESVAIFDTIAVTDDTPVEDVFVATPENETQATVSEDVPAVDTVVEEVVEEVIPETIEEPSVMEALVDMVTTETMTEDAPAIEEVTDEVAPAIESESEMKEEEPKKEEPSADFVGA